MGADTIMNIARSAGRALLAQAALHGKLVEVEWQLEKVRLIKMLGILLSGFACVLCAMLFAGALPVILLWDTPYRIHSIASITALFLLGAAIAWHRWLALYVEGEQAFAATREELAADIALIRSNL